MREIEDYEIQDEKGSTKVIWGRKFDINAPVQKFLSVTDRSFRDLLGDLGSLPGSVQMTLEFIRYLMTTNVLVSKPGIGTVYYYPKGVERSKQNLAKYHTTHELFFIISGIQSGRWDPSEVLHVLVATFPNDPKNKAIRAELYGQAQKIILEGFNIAILV